MEQMVCLMLVFAWDVVTRATAPSPAPLPCRERGLQTCAHGEPVRQPSFLSPSPPATALGSLRETVQRVPWRELRAAERIQGDDGIVK